MCNKATFSEIRFSNAHVILSSWNTDTLRTIHFSKRSINFLRFFTYLISFYTSKHSGRRKNICIYPPSSCWKIQLIKKNQTTIKQQLIQICNIFYETTRFSINLHRRRFWTKFIYYFYIESSIEYRSVLLLLIFRLMHVFM